MKKVYDAEVSDKTFVDKLGNNFEKLHPEVFKAGKLKKAKLSAHDGEFDKALNTLAEGFNIESF